MQRRRARSRTSRSSAATCRRPLGATSGYARRQRGSWAASLQERAREPLVHRRWRQCGVARGLGTATRRRQSSAASWRWRRRTRTTSTIGRSSARGSAAISRRGRQPPVLLANKFARPCVGGGSSVDMAGAFLTHGSRPRSTIMVGQVTASQGGVQVQHLQPHGFPPDHFGVLMEFSLRAPVTLSLRKPAKRFIGWQPVDVAAYNDKTREGMHLKVQRR